MVAGFEGHEKLSSHGRPRLPGANANHSARKPPPAGYANQDRNPMVNPNRTGHTLVPGSVVAGPMGPGASGGAGLDAMLEVVGDGPATGSQHAFLLVISGAEPGRLHVLDKPELVIGRSKYADIRISQRAMSQQHAKLVRTRDGHRLFDLGSTNGSFVNDQQIESANLKAGDVVRTGETVFTYMSSGSSPAASTSDSTMALPTQSRRPRSGVAAPTPVPGTHHHPGGGGGGALVLRAPVAPMPIQNAPQVIGAPLAIPEEESDPLGFIIRILDFIKRYWISMVVFSVLGAGVGVASYKFSKPPVVATFELQLLAKPTDNMMERGRRMNFEFFRSAQKGFTKPSLVRKTLKALGEEKVPPSQIRGVQTRLSLGQGNKRTAPDTYSGSYSAKSGEEALEFLRVHLKFFIDEEIDKGLQVLRVEVETLENKLNQAKDDLNATEQAVMAFKQEHSEGLPEQASAIYADLISLRSERGSASSEVARAIEEARARRKQLKSEAPEIETRIEMARPYEDAITDVNRELSSARAAGKGPQHPDVVKLKKQRKSLEKRRDEMLKNGRTSVVRDRNPVYENRRLAKDDADAGLRMAQSELGRLTNDLERTKKLVQELPRLQREYAELTRSYDATKALHANLIEKLNSSRLQLELEHVSAKGRYELTTPPNVAPPAKMKTIMVRGGALGFVGFAFGIFLGLARDLRRSIAARLAQQGAR